MEKEAIISRGILGRRIAGLVAALTILVGAGLVLLFRYNIYDYAYANYFYQPPAAIATLTNQIDLTSFGRDIFYATNPSLDKSSSGFPCAHDESGSSVILGCYSGAIGLLDPGKIYVLNVQNASLNGVIQVTAAHELLHAVYSRLNIFERQSVDSMVLAEYENIKNDPVIAQQMAYYNITEPGQDINELHSIIGTTIANLDPDLEAYYAKYFRNRSAIVTYYNQYFKALHANDQQISTLKTKLQSDLALIQQQSASYQADLVSLNGDIVAFNTQAGSGGFANQSQFDNARAALLARVNTMESRAAALNQRIDDYNQNIKQLNSMVVETDQMYSSLQGVEEPSRLQ